MRTLLALLSVFVFYGCSRSAWQYLLRKFGSKRLRWTQPKLFILIVVASSVHVPYTVVVWCTYNGQERPGGSESEGDTALSWQTRAYGVWGSWGPSRTFLL